MIIPNNWGSMTDKEKIEWLNEQEKKEHENIKNAFQGIKIIEGDEK